MTNSGPLQLPLQPSALTDLDTLVPADGASPLARTWTPPPPTRERIDAGRRLRREFPRASFAELTLGKRDPLGILAEQNVTRVPELVPLRTERMSASPFAFYRGTAALMAADLGSAPHTGIVVPSCGDAHVANFGFYASPQQTLVFDLNDFDEAAWAPWEWDLKRLITSVVIAGQASSRDEPEIRAATVGAVRAYARTLRESTKLSPRARYFTHFDAEAGIDGLDPASQRVLRKAVKHARRRTGERAARKLTRVGADGRMAFVAQPPTMITPDVEVQQRVRRFAHRYAESASPDIRQLLRGYAVSDVIRRVVGVGSVGTRCALTLFQDGDEHALILQSKEANRSVLEQYGGVRQPRVLQEGIAEHGEGARVVALQRILQAVSDPFLGYLRADGFDLYVRQFHDMKGGIDAETLDDAPFHTYAQACAVTLARAHSQSQHSAIISGYLGGGRVFGEALFAWGLAYAEVSRRDFEAFTSAAAPVAPATEHAI